MTMQRLNTERTENCEDTENLESTMKILIADSVDESVVDILKADPSWNVVNLPKTKGKVEEEIRDADALLVRSATKVTAELLEKAKSLARHRARRRGR